jgi:hypothetical protein
MFPSFNEVKEKTCEGPEIATRGEGEWEPQISFKTFDHCSKINP